MEDRIRARIKDLETLERQAELNLHAIRAALGEFRALLEPLSAPDPPPVITTGAETPSAPAEAPRMAQNGRHGVVR